MKFGSPHIHNSYMIKYMRLCTNLFLAIQFLFLISCTTSRKKSIQPNIIFLLADDMGYTDAQQYGGDIKTPNLNKLAAEGMRFTDFYSAAPNCSPARTGLLTGRTPSRVGVYDYLAPDSPMHLPESEITLAELLKENGYATCHVGKWHLSKWTRYQMQGPKPDAQGFDYWFGVDNNAVPSHKDPTNFERNGQMMGLLKGYSCDLVVDEAIHWLTDVYQPDQPFFLNVWFNEPHAKIASPPDLVEAYKEFGDAAEYMANVANMDQAIGRLMDFLKKRDLEKNTFILFASDNGPYRQESTGAFRGTKSYLYEGGIRVPGIVKWPNHVAAGVESDVPVGLIDFFPTIASVTNSALPTDRTFDGINLEPLLHGEEFERRKPMYWYFYKRYPISALRWGDYVILGNPKDVYKSPSHPFDAKDQQFFKETKLERFEVYNLKDDPGQQINLYEEDPEDYAHLRDSLIANFQSVVTEGPVWEGLPAD